MANNRPHCEVIWQRKNRKCYFGELFLVFHTRNRAGSSYDALILNTRVVSKVLALAMTA